MWLSYYHKMCLKCLKERFANPKNRKIFDGPPDSEDGRGVKWLCN
jgi:hypothetical protein